MFPQPSLYAVDLNVAVLIGVMIITVWMANAWLAGKVLIVLPSYTMPKTPPVFTLTAKTLASIQI